jgi:hypothetical protein
VGTAELASAMGATEWKQSFLRACLAFHDSLAPCTLNGSWWFIFFPSKDKKTMLSIKMRKRFKIVYQLSNIIKWERMESCQVEAV